MPEQPINASAICIGLFGLAVASCGGAHRYTVELQPPAAEAGPSEVGVTVGAGVPLGIEGSAVVNSSECNNGAFEFEVSTGFLMVTAPASAYREWLPADCRVELDDGTRLKVRVGTGSR